MPAYRAIWVEPLEDILTISFTEKKILTVRIEDQLRRSTKEEAAELVENLSNVALVKVGFWDCVFWG